MSIRHTIELDNGIILPEAHIIIRDVKLNYIENVADITAIIYYNITAYNNNRSEVLVIDYKCDSSEFNSYFSESILNQLNKNPKSQAEQFLLNSPGFNGAVQI